MKKVIFIIFAFLSLSPSAFCNTFLFSQYIYSAIHYLDSDEDRKFQAASGLLMVTRELSPAAEAAEAVEEAVDLISSEINSENSISTEKTIELSKGLLYQALSLNRSPLNRSFGKETALFDLLIRMHFFPEHFNDIELAFKNITPSKGIQLILTYLADPRSVQYDPEVASLITGEDLEGNAAASVVIFLLPELSYDQLRTSDDEVSEAELEDELEAELQTIIGQDIPIKSHISFFENGVTIKFEVYGFKYMPLVQAFIQNGLALAGPNRYFFGTANGLEILARNFETAAVGGPSLLRRLAGRLVEPLHRLENGLRSKVFAGSWAEPTPETVKEALRSRANKDIEHMNRNLDRDVARMKRRGRSAADMERRRVRTTGPDGYLPNRMKKLEASLQRVDKAVNACRGTVQYQRSSRFFRARRVFYAAERAAKVRLFTRDRFSKSLSFLLAGYYALEGGIQYFRLSNDPQYAWKRQQLWDIYGVRIVNALMYGVPALGELAMAIDVGGFLANKTILTWFPWFQIPSVEDILNGAIELAVDVRYWTLGTSRFDLRESYIRNMIGIAPMVNHRNAWMDHELTLFRREIEELASREPTPNRSTHIKMAQARFTSHLRDSARRYIGYLSLLNDFVNHEASGDLGDIEKTLQTQLHAYSETITAVYDQIDEMRE